MLGPRTVVDIQYGAPDEWAPIPVDPGATGWVEEALGMLDTDQLDEPGKNALAEAVVEMHEHLSQETCTALGVWVAVPSVPVVTGHVVLRRIVGDGQDVTPETYRREVGMRESTMDGVTSSEITEERLRAARAVKVRERFQAENPDGRMVDTWRVTYALFPKRTNEAVQLEFTAPVVEELTETFLLDAEAMAHSVEIRTARI